MRKVGYGSGQRLTEVLCLVPLFMSLRLLAETSSHNLTIDAAHPMILHLSSGKLVESSTVPNSKGAMICERIHLKGVPRLLNLNKYANTMKVKVKVLEMSSDILLRKVQVCFHRNVSIGIGSCPENEWEKLSQDSCIGSMSPYDYRLLDICIPPPFLSLEISTEEETRLFRLIFLVMGVFLMILALELSESVTFYYSNAMVLGVILVILIILFQGMKLLPTGRKRSLMIFVYGSTVGLGTVLLRYLSGLLQSALSGLGVSADIYNPVALFLLVCLILAGAWLGFWGVRKFVLTEDGSVDISTALFVRWSIRIVGAVMITQSSLDPLLATGAWISAAIFSCAVRTCGVGFLYHMFRYFAKAAECISWFFATRDYLYGEPPIDSIKKNRMSKPHTKAFKWVPCTSPYGRHSAMHEERNGEPGNPTYYSTFHTTPERKRFSQEEWDAFTKDSTRRALKELISSPEFSEWAVSNADRITLTPTENDRRHGSDTTMTRRRWFGWF